MCAGKLVYKLCVPRVDSSEIKTKMKDVYPLVKTQLFFTVVLLHSLHVCKHPRMVHAA